jgi:GDPmannose 4,6-dehydratase
MHKALITGITGQDGSYLAEFLVSKGYEVHGLIRRASTFNTGRVDHLYADPHDPSARLFLHYGDLANAEQMTPLIYGIQPQEIYHLGAQSHVRVSFDMPEYTGDVTGLGTTRLLQAIHRSGIHTKFYQASSSEMFGAAPAPQGEHTAFQPQSPYAVAKVYAYWMVVNYRQGYNLFACNGLLFNHESPRRGETFVTRKVTRAVARILAGQQQKLYLGNLEAKRDWGYAPEYVEAMWRMLQQDTPDDYVIGTGETRSVREFVKAAFAYAGLDWRAYVEIDSRYFRPTEVACLQANTTKARVQLGWEPRVTFEELIAIMIDADMEAVGLQPIGHGQHTLETKFAGWHQWSAAVTALQQGVAHKFE